MSVEVVAGWLVIWSVVAAVLATARGAVLAVVVRPPPPSLNGVVDAAGAVVVAGLVSKELMSGEATAGAVLPPILNGVVEREKGLEAAVVVEPKLNPVLAGWLVVAVVPELKLNPDEMTDFFFI